MQAQLDRLALPPDYVQAWPDALPDGGAAWFYPGGGWVAPAALCAHWLTGPDITTRFGTAVQALLPQGPGWQLRGTDGQPLAHVDAVVLCNAADSGRLLAGLAPAPAPDQAAPASGIDRPLHQVRGQITWLPADTPGLPALPLPLAATGYALRLADGRLLCGASAQPVRPGSQGSPDEPLRDTDHAHNLATLRRLTGWTGAPGPAPLAGRVGWRLQSADRLPLLGPVPAQWVGSRGSPDRGTPACPQPNQARQVRRQPGLYVFTALGSRGLTHAALGGEVLAAWITGDPMPAPASLVDALDPARFIARRARRPG